jgi:hypothetical protein
MRKQLLVAVGAMAGILLGMQAAQAEMQTFYDNTLMKFVSYDVQAVMARGAQVRGASYSPIPRQTISYDGPYSAGTIVVNTDERRLY